MESFTLTYRHTEPLHTQTHIQYQQVKVILEHGVQLFVLFISLLNYLCFTFVRVPQVCSKGLGGVTVVDMYCFYNSVTVASVNFLLMWKDCKRV